MKQFVLSDESLNSYGFKVLTSGISLKRFNQNPVMYYNHNCSQGVIGRWIDLSIKDNRLLGTPVFDEKDALGAKIAGKVNDGFIKAVSIGITNAVLEVVKGEHIVTSCELQECSICDIPSNENALMLYVDDKQITSKEEILKLCNPLTNNKMKTELKRITDALNLSSDASVDDIVRNIQMLSTVDSAEKVIVDALKMNFVAKYETEELLQLAQANPSAFHSYIDKRKQKALQERKEEGMKLFHVALRDGRINGDSTGTIESFWLNSFEQDFDATKHAIASLPQRASLSRFISEDSKNEENRHNWTLADYRKKAPLELKNNPALYQRLLAEDKLNK